MTAKAQAEDPRLAAAIDLLRRTGATEVQVRYSDDPQPLVWMAVARWKDNHESAGAMSPLRAVLRLLEVVVDGGTCRHCSRPSAVSDDFTATMPLADHVCWYQFDPELSVFRRGCEGDDHWKGIGRNDSCPCGSGVKFKRCHGSRW